MVLCGFAYAYRVILHWQWCWCMVTKSNCFFIVFNIMTISFTIYSAIFTSKYPSNDSNLTSTEPSNYSVNRNNKYH